MKSKPRNLYVIHPVYSADPVETYLFRSDADALDFAITRAAMDRDEHGSPEAAVYRLDIPLTYVGAGVATDCPYDWAHPGVEENVALEACLEAEAAVDEDGAA